jgi:hypothetical protein
MLYSHVAISTLWFIDSLGCCSNLQLISLIFAIMIMARNDTGDVTMSFSDTAILTRNLDADASAGEKLRLKAAEDGKLEYIFEYDQWDK